MESLLNNIKNIKVAVIGDIILDHYIWGDANRISPEAPVPVIDVSKDSYVPGGAANVALNVNALGAKAQLCGSIANDDAGAQLKHMLSQAGVSLDPRFSQCQASTILKTRVLVRNQQLCRIDREAAPTDYAIEDEELISLIEEKIKYVDAVILSDYKKGVITDELMERVTQAASAKGAIVAMDPKPRSDLHVKGIDLLTPNRSEALALAGIQLEKHEKFPAEEVCKLLWNKYEPRYLVITMGAEGMLLCEDGQNLKFIPTLAQEVYDVSGAGDTVVSTLATALAAQATLEDAAQLANIAAGIVVSKVGTATANPQEILSYTPVEDTLAISS